MLRLHLQEFQQRPTSNPPATIRAHCLLKLRRLREQLATAAPAGRRQPLLVDSRSGDKKPGCSAPIPPIYLQAAAVNMSRHQILVALLAQAAADMPVASVEL